MSKCPFWSSKKEKVSCNSECPINPTKNNNEECPFVEHLSTEKISFKDILGDDFAYSQDSDYDYVFSSYSKFK